MLLLIAVQILLIGQILVGGEEDADGATGWVADHLIRARPDQHEVKIRRGILPAVERTRGDRA